MRDVSNGWLLRYRHANGAGFFFIVRYLHIARGLYYGSYRYPRTLTWTIGVIILILTRATGFLGYCLPYGQRSHWGATVITNLLSAIPWIGNDRTTRLWGAFSVSNPTINRFFSLHYLLPFILAALVVRHFIALHEHGSGNPLGISANSDRIPMAPYFLFKDLVTVFARLLVFSAFVFYAPNALGHSDNYIPANPLSTPASIVPEFYLLPFYAILRSIESKVIGVLARFVSRLILLARPVLDTGVARTAYRPLRRFAFWIFVADFLILGYLGSCHVEDPYVGLSQIATTLYFAWFAIIVPAIGIMENTLFDLR